MTTASGAGSDLSVWPFRLFFRAIEPVYFPAGKASNILRGAFGTIFRQLACIPECRDAKSCERAPSCSYAAIFEPRQEWTGMAGPSGMADWPRPFVFRALHLDNVRLAPGEEFHFDLVLFQDPVTTLPHFVSAFRELGRSGLGPSRGLASLERVDDLASGEAVFADYRLVNRRLDGIRLDLRASCASDRCVLRFVSPTELKSQGEVVARPEFAVLFARLRDRISNLRALYQGGALDVDFQDSGRKAEGVAIVRSSLQPIHVERRSSRTGRSHPLGGFVGEVEYAGDLGDFMPFLRAGEWTGVGRQTVWGKGQFTLPTQ